MFHERCFDGAFPAMGKSVCKTSLILGLKTSSRFCGHERTRHSCRFQQFALQKVHHACLAALALAMIYGSQQSTFLKRSDLAVICLHFKVERAPHSLCKPTCRSLHRPNKDSRERQQPTKRLVNNWGDPKPFTTTTFGWF